jgi:hypothetical protein
MFNLFKKKDTPIVIEDTPIAIETQAPATEVLRISDNHVKIGSVKHLMTAAIIANQAIKINPVIATPELKPIVKTKIEVVDKESPTVTQTLNTIDTNITPRIIEEDTIEKKEFKPFIQITPPPMENTESMPAIPNKVGIWFLNCVNNLMNGLPIEKESDFYILMNEMADNDELNPSPSHIGLHKIKHFITTQMNHMFDITKNEIEIYNFPSLNKGVMIMGPTPDNNIILAGNLSSLETADWDNIHQSLQAQIA